MVVNMRPSTPSLGFSQSAGPSSPPQTPTTASSPAMTQKNSPMVKTRSFSPLRRIYPNSSSMPNIRPVGYGHSFSYTRPIRPQDLSPPYAISSDSESSRSVDPPRSVASEYRDSAPSPPQKPRSRPGRVITSHASFALEEMSNSNESDASGLEVIRPTAIEFADSDRSRSRSRHRPEIDPAMMSNLRNLNCSDVSDDEINVDKDEYEAFLLARRQERRRVRANSGSVGKRTISESIGSDSDHEDIHPPFLDANEVGSSARRLRRRLGGRQSLLFQDPPLPRIDGSDESNLSEEDIIEGESLARELPYYNWEYVSVMEVDTS